MMSSPVDQERIRRMALEFLERHHTLVLATVSATGEPQASVVYFVVGDGFELYLMTTKGSRKCENIRASGKAAFVVGAGPDLATLQGGGPAELLDEKEATVFTALIERLALSSASQWPLLKLSKGKGYCLFRIRPSWLTWLVMDKEHYPDIAREEFYQVI